MKTLYVTCMEQPEAQIEQLRSIDGLKVISSGLESTSEYTIPSEIASEIDMLFCEYLPQNFEELTNVKLVQICSTGYSQLFDRGLLERGIRACNGRGEFDIPIAEWAIAMMINLNRDLRGMLRNQDEKIWDRAERFQTELRGKTLGLFGYGSLARELARLAKTMGLTIHAYDRERVDFSTRNYYSVEGTGDPQCLLPDKFYTPGQETEFFSSLDFLAIAMPLTKVTEGLVSEAYLRALPKGAYLLNFARGPIIEEQGLLRVLEDGHLGGAALDTHYHYPMPQDHPLWNFPNVIMTPHISGSNKSTNFLPRIYDICAQNAIRFLSGEPLLNELTDFQLSGN